MVAFIKTVAGDCPLPNVIPHSLSFHYLHLFLRHFKITVINPKRAKEAIIMPIINGAKAGAGDGLGIPDGDGVCGTTPGVGLDVP